MKYRIIAVLTLFVFVLNFGASTFADTKSTKAGAIDLVGLLPASDAVVLMDSKRFFGEALPRLLSSNQALLTKANAKVDDLKARIGIDVRDFDSIAAGVTVRQIGEKKYDGDAVIIGRGQMTSASLVGAAKLASNGKYREERIGERVMYIFDLQKAAAPKADGGFFDNVTEIAVAALDGKTTALGQVARVRQTLEAKTRVSVELVTMLETSMNAVGAFAVKPPAGLKSFLPLENDELGKNIDSIQYVYGNATVAADNATLHVTARTFQNAQAKSLYDTLEGLRIFGRALLGATKGADKQVYARMVENAKFSMKGNEVVLDLTVPQSDIDILIGMIGN